MLNIGDTAPDFELTDQYGESRHLYSLLRDGPVVLYFYPADFTPGCTKEACSIRDIHGEIAAAGLRVIGVSPQDTDSHRRFGEQYRLPYPLLADTDKTIIKAYDVDGPFGFGVRRATFLIGADGVIEDVLMADLMIGRHTEFIQRALAAQAVED